MITELTQEQEAQIDVYCQKWIKIGTSTEQPDKAYIETVVAGMYEKAGFKCPKITWCDSPLALMIRKTVVAKIHDKNPRKAHDDEYIQKEIEKFVSDPNYSTNLDFSGVCYGAHDAHWLAYYDYFDQVLHVPGAEKIRDLVEMAKVGWWAPYDTDCFISLPPVEIHLDDENELHSETGPAIAYKDGVKIYCVHGVRVPEVVIMAPETQSLKEILEEVNEEVKRIRISQYGWGKFLEQTGAEIIDSKMVTLEESSWLESLYYLESQNLKALATYDPSTGRPYFLEVSLDCDNCTEAQQYLNGSDVIEEFLDSVQMEDYPVLRT